MDDELDQSAKDTAASAEPSEKLYAGMTRRTLCYGIGGAAALLAVGGLTFVSRDPLVRPPGGQDEDRLVSACIRCEKCYEVCPRAAIAPAHVEDGVLNTRTPVMDFSNDYCDLCIDENNGDPLCVKVCPTKALNLPNGVVSTTILGVAKINTTECLAYRMTGCRFCYDACPHQGAITLDDINRPVVDESKCNGCGACESVCVSLKEGSISSGATQRAIVVEPLG